MASYFQNLTSSLPSFSTSSTPPPRGQLYRAPPSRSGPDAAQQTTTSNLSSLGSALSSRLTSLRRVLTSGAEDDDPDSEESSHVSKVLRAYYTEKGRPFPSWLPPDPKAPPPAPMPQQQPVSQWGGFNQQQPGPTVGGRGGVGLSDLWEDQGGRQTPPAAQSLRRQQPGGAPSPRPGFAASQNPASSLGARGRAPSPGLGPDYGAPAARPLPSQRAGSYQQSQQGSFASSQGPRRPAAGTSTESYTSVSSMSSSGSGTSARDRLRAGLTGGRSTPTSQTLPPPPGQPSYGGGGGYGDDRQGSYGRDQKPFTGASSPWVSGDDGYGFGGGGYSGDPGYGGGGGLSRRQQGGGGLPNGPRLRGPRS